jgi:hypothetical protein
MAAPTSFVASRSALVWAAAQAGIVTAGLTIAALFDSQGGASAAAAVRVGTLMVGGFWLVLGLCRLAAPRAAWPPAVAHAALLGGGAVAAEALARLGWNTAGIAVGGAAAAASAGWIWRLFAAAPRWRAGATGLAAILASAATAWILVRHGRPVAATGLTGITALSVGFGVGLVGIRRLLGGATGIAGVARAVIDEAVRMRAAVAMVVILVVLVPTLPLVLDHAERLQYRVQFVLAWTLGGTALVLAVLTIVLGCGSVCGDIDSGRIHMTLAKPLHRWEYLAGKWLGLVLFDLLLVAVAGGGAYTFVTMLSRTKAVDATDRAALDREVLTARVATEPLPANPQEYEAAVAAAIEQLERDEPELFARNPAAARRRIRQEYDWQWHTVTADMVSTFVFRGLADAKRSAADATLQLRLKPRAQNVDVDLADVRFAVWLNDRPWPVRDGRHEEQTLPTLAVSVLDLPAAAIDEEGVLRVTVANRNLVPDGETRPTVITFSPGDGMRLYRTVGGFAGNFLRCLAVIWIKLAMIAALAIAAASCLGFPLAVLGSLVAWAAAVGSGFLKTALGLYNVEAPSLLDAVGERLRLTWRYATDVRLYEAFRMLFGFVTDLVVWIMPAFSDYDAVGSLVSGTAIAGATVASCAWWIGIVPTLVLGVVACLAFERRDLVRPSC